MQRDEPWWKAAHGTEPIALQFDPAQIVCPLCFLAFPSGPLWASLGLLSDAVTISTWPVAQSLVALRMTLDAPNARQPSLLLSHDHGQNEAPGDKSPP